MDLGISNKRAVVCGGSAGIGLACARALGEEGVVVHLVARSEQNLSDAAKDLKDAGISATVTACDLNDAGSVSKILSDFPNADIVVTNPGVSPGAKIDDASVDDWQNGVSSIVGRPMELARAFVPGMRANGFGRIVHISSGAFASANLPLAFSGALRAALTHASAGLARAVAMDGITSNCIAPTSVETAGFHHVVDREAQQTGSPREDVYRRRIEAIPCRRLVQADEVGKLCAFLSSVHAASITGKTIVVDGGVNPYPFL